MENWKKMRWIACLLILGMGVSAGCDRMVQSVQQGMQGGIEQARREVRGKQLKALGIAYHNYMDGVPDHRGPANWDAFDAFLQAAPPDVQQPIRELRAAGIEVHWGMKFAEVRQGTTSFVLAHDPKDLQGEGGMVLMGDGSTRWMRTRAIQILLAYQRGETTEVPILPVVESIAENEAKQAARERAQAPAAEPSANSIAASPSPPPPPPPPPTRPQSPPSIAASGAISTPNTNTAAGTSGQEGQANPFLAAPSSFPETTRQPESVAIPSHISPWSRFGGTATGRDTEILGGAGGNPFRNVGQLGQPVIGFRYTLGAWAGQNGVGQLLPLSKGDRSTGGPMVVTARDGYALGGLEVDADQYVNAIRPIFMRVAGNGQLDPADTYQGEWIGARTNRKTRILSGEGVPVIGFVGRGTAMLDAVGLVLAE